MPGNIGYLQQVFAQLNVLNQCFVKLITVLEKLNSELIEIAQAR
jgi:hypothetical protein